MQPKPIAKVNPDAPGTVCRGVGLQSQLVQGSPVTVYATLEIFKINLTTACKLAAMVTGYEF
ncbi:MAG: hypothetical protein WA802_14225 [Terracidiphilus sp.]